jgi:predicted glycosyltransferase involved in capsule biosynthesis
VPKPFTSHKISSLRHYPHSHQQGDTNLLIFLNVKIGQTMEALGAAASIAGILSLAGQSINGIVKLRVFIKDTKSASKTVDSFLSDVDAFEGSLTQIQELLLRLSSNKSTPVVGIGLETLKW